MCIARLACEQADMTNMASLTVNGLDAINGATITSNRRDQVNKNKILVADINGILLVYFLFLCVV